jgi:hypothetical protein
VADAREREPEDERRARQEAHVQLAVLEVVAGAGHVGVGDARVMAADLDRLHAMRGRELRAGARDVLVEQPQAAERAQGDLQRRRHVEVHPRLADVARRERVAEHLGHPVEQLHLRGERRPVALVAQLRLAALEAGQREQAVDGLPTALARDVVEDELRRDATGLTWLRDLVEGVEKDGRGFPCAGRHFHEEGVGIKRLCFSAGAAKPPLLGTIRPA